jgi:hypothetical protein
MTTESKTSARCATVDEIHANIAPNFFTPVPPKRRLRYWFNKANIPRFKANLAAKGGGGVCYFSLPHVEAFFRRRITLPVVGRWKNR